MPRLLNSIARGALALTLVLSGVGTSALVVQYEGAKQDAERVKAVQECCGRSARNLLLLQGVPETYGSLIRKGAASPHDWPRDVRVVRLWHTLATRWEGHVGVPHLNVLFHTYGQQVSALLNQSHVSEQDLAALDDLLGDDGPSGAHKPLLSVTQERQVAALYANLGKLTEVSLSTLAEFQALSSAFPSFVTGTLGTYSETHYPVGMFLVCMVSPEAMAKSADTTISHCLTYL